jgi:hypothetical protein
MVVGKATAKQKTNILPVGDENAGPAHEFPISMNDRNRIFIDACLVCLFDVC